MNFISHFYFQREGMVNALVAKRKIMTAAGRELDDEGHPWVCF
jgi:hypothetical protein